MVLLRDNVANAHNLFQATSLFVLIESASGMFISLDYQPIQVNIQMSQQKVTPQNATARTKLPEYGILS